MAEAGAEAEANPPRPFKLPQSVLVVIHTPALQVLLIERADAPGFWQSVTGAKDHPDEPFEHTAVREVAVRGVDDAVGPFLEEVAEHDLQHAAAERNAA